MDTIKPSKIDPREDIMDDVMNLEYKKIQEERMLKKEPGVPDYPDELNRDDYDLLPEVEDEDSKFNG